METMKNQIVEMLRDRNDIPITLITDSIPESKGVNAMFIPVVAGFNPNIFMCINVNVEFIQAFNELRNAGIIDIKPTTLFDFIFWNAPIIGNCKIATLRYCKKGKGERWLPVVIYRGINFYNF